MTQTIQNLSPDERKFKRLIDKLEDDKELFLKCANNIL